MSSCGTVKLSVKPGATFSRNATLTIPTPEDHDETGTYGELNHLLLEKGFNVIPYSTAMAVVKYKDKIEGSDPVNDEFEGETERIKELNAVYVLELNYAYYYDVFYYSYTNFSARVFDLKSGEIVLTANFRGDRSVRSVLKDFTTKLAAQIK